ncbi:hypothetical protein BCR34DRAFT_597373 [Clohesyomyces aquaticus]|uniref:Major facilitator superfamily (MFS) profile domain-containing protein n=1 Tax=Clohesyomyces aquaticus TaxID=1231657 RepID=A0A1Y2A3X4_9PLEO|nr:hypothetical protein BCR34DRAFT_597373 [Clohesyomyces aquaticus]
MSVPEKPSSSPTGSSKELAFITEPQDMNEATNMERASNAILLRDNSSAREMKPLPWFSIVFSLLVALFLFALDNTIVADIQAKIIYALGDIEKLSWVSVAFALGAVGTNLLWGKLYSFFDRKPLFIASVANFEVGSALCGAAPTLDVLISG